ncbi:MAG: hypothetical protein KatS3mg122_1242 [Caldimonas sp.]|uniref:PAS domain S-box protein n=1 Tax=Caldimonas taiwanensis TaxID=307483 RepID=UPI000782FE89|nr:PAS domain S-box protein [Caldimonas taiwanensis]GIX24011.1 MAG: hypothetical protein KatS3mg122_1242 [Caldimonas sp.]
MNDLPSLWRVLVDDCPDAVMLLSPDGRVCELNATAQQLFGYDPAEAAGVLLSDLIAPAGQADAVAQSLARARDAGVVVEEVERRRRDGSLVSVSASTKAVLDPQGRLQCYLCTMKDVTHLKVLRQAQWIESRYRTVLEFVPDAIVIANASGCIVYANTQAERMFGYASRQWLGLPVEQLLPERLRAAHAAHRGRYAQAPRARTMGAGLELLGQRRDGREFPVEISLSPMVSDEGVLIVSAVRDLSEREELRRRADRKFKDLLESAPDAMVIVDAHGRIVLINSQTERLFGWSRTELLGQSIEILVPSRLRGVHPDHRARFMSNPKVRSMGAGLALAGLRKDGSEFPVEISLSPIETEDGLVISAAIRDATERKRIEASLHEANRLKSEFLANMSHELRTPLNGVLGFSELLIDELAGPLNAKQREYVQDILNCGRHLLQLINDVLDLSKIEAGKMDLRPEVFQVEEALQEVCTIINAQARKKSMQVQTLLPAALPPVRLDRQKFKQILFNLLSNAVKFTDSGGHIGVRMEVSSQPPLHWLKLSVSDTGIGIAPQDLGHLFEAFRQLDGGLSRRYEGTGLGLALTRKLVELHGGRIEVQSTPGQGSTFTVWLPWHTTLEAAAP